MNRGAGEAPEYTPGRERGFTTARRTVARAVVCDRTEQRQRMARRGFGRPAGLAADIRGHAMIVICSKESRRAEQEMSLSRSRNARFHHDFPSFIVTGPGRRPLNFRDAQKKRRAGGHHEASAAKTSCSAAQRVRFRATRSWPVVLLAR